MATPTEPGPGLPPRWGHTLPAIARAALLCAAWLPFFALFLILLPRCDRVFAKLAKKQVLPPLTLRLARLGHLNTATHGTPTLGFFAWLIFADLVMVRATSRSKGGKVLYRVWFAAVLLMALFACILFFVAVQSASFKYG